MRTTKVVNVRFIQVMCYYARGVARGGAEVAVAPPEFGRSVNPIQTRGADYTPHTTASPPGFKKLSTPLILQWHTHLNVCAVK